MDWKNKLIIIAGGAAMVLGLTCNSKSYAEGLERGKMLYESSCLHCHGEKGDGNGPEAVNYDPRPTNFTSSRMYEISDSMIEKAIVVGIPTVSTHAWDTRLRNDEIAAVIQYINTFRK